MLRVALFSRSGLVLLFFSALPSLAHAQAYQRIAPHQPPVTKAPQIVMPTQDTTPVGGSEMVLLPELKGLVFLDNTNSVIHDGVPDNQIGIHQQGLPSLSTGRFAGKMSRFLGRKLTMASLNQISRVTEDWYRTRGYPFLSVSVPPQNISNGIVQVVVTQYKVGEVRVAGNRWFSSHLIKQQSGLRSGQTLDLAKVRADMSWLNENDFRTVSAIFSPGAQQGTTDVTLQTKDHLPLYVYSTYDNQGVPTQGRGEWGVGAVWGNMLNHGQVLSYQFTRSVTGQYSAHSANWSAPLPWRDKVILFGSYATERPDVGAVGEGFDEVGHSSQASLRYVHRFTTVQISPSVSLITNIQVGYDFKSSNNDLEFGGVKVFKGTAQIAQFPIIFNADEGDAYGQTTFQNEIDLSPGGLTATNNKEAFEKLVPGSSASYYVDQVSLMRTTFLPYGLSWTSRVLRQFTNHNQMYSNQLSLGGMYSVRGYYTDSALGSQGIFTQNEIRTPAFSVMGMTRFKSDAGLHDNEQLGVFFDYGHVAQIQPIPDTVNSADLASAGVDLHTTIGNAITVVWDVGWRLRNAPTYGGKGGGFGDVAATVGF